MLRSSVLLFFVLTSGIIAKTLKPWDKVANEAVQKGWVSVDDKGMASWGVEVEPPEDMDKTSFDIDPSMKIGKRVQIEQSKQYQMSEDDLDDLQHPSTADLLKAYAENKLNALPASDIQGQDGENNQNAEEDRLDLEDSPFMPVEDLDEVLYPSEKDVYKYLAPLVAGYKGEPEVQAVHSKPEQDEDDMYHADVHPGIVVVPLESEIETKIQGRLYLEPEEDMDDIYHKDIPEMILYNSEAQPAAADWPILKKHTNPEEDLDAIYHN